MHRVLQNSGGVIQVPRDIYILFHKQKKNSKRLRMMSSFKMLSLTAYFQVLHLTLSFENTQSQTGPALSIANFSFCLSSGPIVQHYCSV